MNNSIYRVSLDIHDTASQTMLNVKKSDNGRQINFVLTDGGKPYVITEGCKAYFRALKPSKENLLFNECTIANNVITYILTNQTSAEVGIVDCEIRLNGADGKQITSPRFSLCVEDIIYSDSEVESKDEFTALQTALEKADKLIADISNKVDKVPGKDLSTNDFTTELKDKLDGMEEGANKTTVDAELSATSENPVQNKIVKAALDKKITEPTTNGLVRKFMNGIYGTMGVDTTMPTSPTNNSVPSTKLLEDKLKNALGMSDANLQKSGLLIQTYIPAGSTPGTVGTRIYSVIERDVSTLDDTSTGTGKVPSSYVVGNYVKESISAEQSRAENTFSNALKGSKSGGAFLINDISPVTHEMGVKISSDTVEDLTAVKVRKQGKNLIPFPYRDLTLGTSTYNGVDFTVYEDGSILINGTATKSTTKYLYNNATDLLGLKSGITISGGKNASDDTQQGNVYFVCNYYDSTGSMKQGLLVSTASSGMKTITDAWKGLGIYINIPNGKTLNNLLIKPQLEIGATATEYEPYITPTEYIPTADGTVNGVTSLYPNTTLTTDTEGVIINCNYNRDINKAFAALEAALATTNFLTNTEAGS